MINNWKLKNWSIKSYTENNLMFDERKSFLRKKNFWKKKFFNGRKKNLDFFRKVAGSVRSQGDHAVGRHGVQMRRQTYYILSHYIYSCMICLNSMLACSVE